MSVKGYGKFTPGFVIRVKPQEKTAICAIRLRHYNSKYKRFYFKTTRLQVHDEYLLTDPGDKVLIAQSRKYSKSKAHAISSILEKERGIAFLRNNPEYLVTKPGRGEIEQRFKHRDKIKDIEKGIIGDTRQVLRDQERQLFKETIWTKDRKDILNNPDAAKYLGKEFMGIDDAQWQEILKKKQLSKSVPKKPPFSGQKNVPEHRLYVVPPDPKEVVKKHKKPRQRKPALASGASTTIEAAKSIGGSAPSDQSQATTEKK